MVGDAVEDAVVIEVGSNHCTHQTQHRIYYIGLHGLYRSNFNMNWMIRMRGEKNRVNSRFTIITRQ